MTRRAPRGEHEIGETAGGGADIETVEPGRIDGEGVEGGLELERAARGVGVVGLGDLDDRRPPSPGLPALVTTRPSTVTLPARIKRLGAGPGGCETALGDLDIEAPPVSHRPAASEGARWMLRRGSRTGYHTRSVAGPAPRVGRPGFERPPACYPSPVSRPNEERRTGKSLIPGLLISGAAVVALVAFVDFSQAAAALRSARPVEMVAATVLFVVALTGRAAASRELVDGRTGLGGAFAALNIGYLANNLLPLRAGEAVRSLVLGRKTGLGLFGGATAVVAERLLDLIFAATILLAGLSAVGVESSWAPAAAAALAALTGVTVLVVIARRRARHRRLARTRDHRPAAARRTRCPNSSPPSTASPNRIAWSGPPWFWLRVGRSR